jgi:hypothetical protein
VVKPETVEIFNYNRDLRRLPENQLNEAEKPINE